MATLCKTFSTEAAARRAIAALRAAGVPAHDLRLLTGRPLGDIRQAPVGGYARPFGHDAPLGTFGGGAVRRQQGAGGFAGDPDQQRQGSFGDVNRIVIVTYDHGAERARVNGLRQVRRLLRRAGLGDDAVARAVNELHTGRAIVLVDLRAIAAGGACDQRDRVQGRGPLDAITGAPETRRSGTRSQTPVPIPPGYSKGCNSACPGRADHGRFGAYESVIAPGTETPA